MGIEYSDGSEVENRIVRLIADAEELHSLTSIAHEEYHDWPVKYHLSPERGNLLRHLDFSNLKVLELGAGMGAVSRLLAEKSHSLTVVEGTETRFQALCERLRDLKNWKGQVANIMEVSFQEPFDVVVVVGALEYSELFVTPTEPGDSPFDAFLRKAKSFLKPNGVFILAIENQMGFKYLNGAPEDHTDGLYDGISGYPQRKTPKTFSRRKLLKLLDKAGFRAVQEYFPFPDYKLVTSVLTPIACLTEPTLSAELASQSSREGHRLWNDRLGAQSIAEANLLPDLANSFLMVSAENSDSPTWRKVLPPSNQLAWHYSVNRKSPTCTFFSREQNGQAWVKKAELATPLKSSLVTWNSKLEPLLAGRPVRENLLRLGYFENSDEWYKLFTDYLTWATKKYATESVQLLREDSVDALFTNAVEDPHHGYMSFDLEWVLKQKVSTSWFILRNVLALHEILGEVANLAGFQSLKDVYLKTCEGFQVSPHFEGDLQREAELQSEITPESSQEKFIDALKARLEAPLKRKIVRQTSGEVELRRTREARLFARFPDFLSAMDRPSTKLFLSVDEALRKSHLLRSFYQGLKEVVRKAYRLFPTNYEVRETRNVGESDQVTTLNKTFGAYPKVGWSEIRIRCAETELSPAALRLELLSQGRKFKLALPRTGKTSYRKFLRLHENVESLSLITNASDDLAFTSIQTRNLLKAEVVLRLVSPGQLDFGRIKAYWKQGKLRGVISYLHSIVLKADIGVVESYSDWAEKYDTLRPKDRAQIEAHLETFTYQPKISILMPVFNTPPKWLEKAVQSVEAQLYRNWELCIADDASTDPHTQEYLNSLKERDSRIQIVRRATNGHISEASNSALEMATGDYVAILDHDDEIAETALYHTVRELNANQDLNFLYSDEDKIDTDNRRFLPHFKTDWNPELFYCYNLITHFAVIKTSLVKEVGGFRQGYEGSQDYDLFLRCIENLKPSQIRHMPYVLYHWRVLDSSTSGHIAAKPYAKTAALRALNEHIKRQGMRAIVEEGYNDCFRMRYLLPETAPKVSVIICTRDREDLLRTIVDGLLNDTDYPSLEILIVNNQSQEAATLKYFSELSRYSKVRILNYNYPFNFAAMNNLAAKEAQGDILAFLNNDLKVVEKNWLNEMVAFAIQPHVGAVGARLLYPSGKLQHGGVILGIGGVAGHSHKGFGPHDKDFYARTRVSQCISAVTAACLVVKKSVFEEVSGFDENHLTVAFNDVDLCLKIRERGLHNIWTPYATLIHFESESRGSDQRPETFPRFQREEAFMKQKWGSVLKKDPYYSPNLTLQRENFDFAYPPRVEKPWKQFTPTSSPT